MPRAITPTLLNLSDYARVLGIGPMHFSQGVSTLRPESACSEVWFQFDWQDPKKASREQIGILISDAEKDIADALGYWPAPKYITGEGDNGEFHLYQRSRQPEWFGLGVDVRYRLKSTRLNRGYVIAGGQRATEYIGTYCWVPVDADGDGFTELAKFEFDIADTNVTDRCEIHAFFKEYDEDDAANSRTDPSSAGADESWEVRPLRTVLSGTTMTIYTWVWDLFRPQLQEELAPTEIDADDFGPSPPSSTDDCEYLGQSDMGSYVDELMFYRVYTDPETQVEFLWGNDVSCSNTACADTTQAGCFRIEQRRSSLVVPEPGTYNSVTETFTASSWTQCVEPDAVAYWYLAGWTPETSRGCVTLDQYWARTIAMLATARLEWPLCDCTNVRQLSDYWRQDVSMMTKEKSFLVNPGELSNPFGTRVGEILAWRRVAARSRKRGQTVNV